MCERGLGFLILEGCEAARSIRRCGMGIDGRLGRCNLARISALLAADDLGPVEVFLPAHPDIRTAETASRPDSHAAIRRHRSRKAPGASCVAVDAVSATEGWFLEGCFHRRFFGLSTPTTAVSTKKRRRREKSPNPAPSLSLHNKITLSKRFFLHNPISVDTSTSMHGSVSLPARNFSLGSGVLRSFAAPQAAAAVQNAGRRPQGRTRL